MISEGTMSGCHTIVQLSRAEARKLTGRALLWAEIGILAALVAALYAALAAALAAPQQQGLPPEAVEALKASLQWPQGLPGGLAFAGSSGLGGLFVVVLTAAVVGQEYTWRTVHLWLSRGVGRGAYLAAKALTLGGAGLLLALTAFVAGAAVTAAYTLHTTGALPWRAAPWGAAALGVLATALSLAPYAAFTLLAAISTRSALAAAGIGLGYNLLVENMAAKILLMVSPQASRLARYLPAFLGQSLQQSLAPGTEVSVGVSAAAGAPALLSPSLAACLLAAYTLAALALGWWVFRRQDITA
jgi:ABC-type transport system involved in multi-copper enzyme maturation permease subunit